MRNGDVIVGLGDREIRAPEDLFAALRERAPGEQVTVTVVREGERNELEATLGDRAA